MRVRDKLKSESSERAISSSLTPLRARIVFTPSNVCSLHPDNRHPWKKLSKDLKTRLVLISCFQQRRASVCKQSESWRSLQKFHWSSPHRFSGYYSVDVSNMQTWWLFFLTKWLEGRTVTPELWMGIYSLSSSATAAHAQQISNVAEWGEARLLWGAGCSRVAADPP